MSLLCSFNVSALSRGGPSLQQTFDTTYKLTFSSRLCISEVFYVALSYIFLGNVLDIYI